MMSKNKAEVPIIQNEKSKLTSEYKILMDEMLEKHEKGDLEYTDWNDFKKTFNK